MKRNLSLALAIITALAIAIGLTYWWLTNERPSAGHGDRTTTVYAAALCTGEGHGMDLQIEVPGTGFRATIFNLCDKGEQAAFYYRCEIPVGKQGAKTEVITRARAHGTYLWSEFTEVTVNYYFDKELAFDYLIASDGSIPMPRCPCTWQDADSWKLTHRLHWPGEMGYPGPPASDGSWSDNPACVP